jgi:hypothetical protein
MSKRNFAVILRRVTRQKTWRRISINLSKTDEMATDKHTNDDKRNKEEEKKDDSSKDEEYYQQNAPPPEVRFL